MKNKICLFMALALLITCLTLAVGCAGKETPEIETPESVSTTVQTSSETSTSATEKQTERETSAVTSNETQTTVKPPYETTPVVPETRIDQTVYVPETEETEHPPIKYTMNPPPKRDFPELPDVPEEPDITMKVDVYEGSGKTPTGYLFSVGKVDSISADGTMTVTLAGNKVENAQKLNWTFIYLDFDGNLHRAGNSTSVALKSTDEITAPVKKAIEDYKKARDDYHTTLEYGMSESIKAEYFVKATEAYEAYEQAKQKAAEDFLDGQFWGVENSAVYKYINGYKYTYQKEPEDVTFYFILKDGEYCVLVNTFFKA